ncbi:MAG: hypothetical protein COW65_05205 [Cytophagales bacterium CG18_big_fil_WC_8_21_14_2_50_42_9]|nr:MAG: hypothetical protein COW65_05205 [Cytophagales bacterium CG18_big_fil_WC_8_21_14_2_50_42_9]
MKKVKVSNPVFNKRFLPLNYEDIEYREKFICESYTTNASYISELKNAYVSPYGVVFKNFKIIKESVYPGYNDHSFYLTFLKKILLRRINYVSGTCIVAIYAYYDNYYHFVSDILPRLFNVLDYATEAKVLMHERMPGFVKEYLELLGFSNIEFIKDDELAYVKRLFLPTFTAGKHSHNSSIMKDLVKHIKSKNRTNKDFSDYRNVYVSRRKDRYRKVLNEDEVIGTVEKFGFKTIYLEDYTVPEQISLMSQVKNLIAIHGAGITNIMYMPENGLVVELIHPQHHIDCFYNLANVFNHDTIILQGVAEVGSADPIHDNFSINTAKLKNYLNKFLK